MKHKKLAEFELLREVGLDSLKSSRVFLAQDIKADKHICLKIADRDFEREYNILEELLHGAGKVIIPQPYEFGDIEFEDSIQHYLSREFISGIDLFTYFKDYAFTTMDQRAAAVIDTIKEVSLVVSYIHSKGKYHRDLKPADFVKDEKGTALIDFETVLNEGEECLDRHIIFSAPEIIDNLSRFQPGHRSDIYSLGQITFALLIADNSAAYRSFIRNTNFAQVNQRYKLGILPQMLKVIQKATNYLPDKRYDSTKDLTQALEQAKS